MSRPDITLSNSIRTCIIGCKEEFKYKRPMPKKRTHIKESNKAVIVQREVPCFVMTDIKFSGKVNKDTADCLEALHRDCETVEMEGQYGEEYNVQINIEEMEEFCEYVKISGNFKVLCEITPPQPRCQE